MNYRNIFLIFSFTFMLSTTGSFAQDIPNDDVTQSMKQYLKALNGGEVSQEKLATQLQFMQKVRNLWQRERFQELRHKPLKDIIEQNIGHDLFISAVAFHEENVEEVLDHFNEYTVPKNKTDILNDILMRAIAFRSDLRRFSFFTLYRKHHQEGGQIRTVMFKPKSPTLVFSQRNKIINLFMWDDPMSGTYREFGVGSFLEDGNITSMDVASHQMVTSSASGLINLRGYSDPFQIQTFKANAIAYSIALDKGSKTSDPIQLAVGSSNGTIQIFGIHSKTYDKIYRSRSGGSTFALIYHPDGSLIAGDLSGPITIWDRQGNQSELLGHQNIVWSLALTLDGSILASESDDKTVRLWDWNSKKEVAILEDGHAGGHGLAFSPDNHLLASIGKDHSVPVIKIWDVKTHTQIESLRGHEAFVTSVSFSDDGTLLASSDDAGNIFIWQIVRRYPDLGLIYMADPVRDGEKK